MNKIKIALPFLVIFILLLIIRGNIIAISEALDNPNTTANLKKKLSDEQKKNEYLREQLYYVKTNQFVVDQAQQKLGLLQPQEYFVIAPTPAPIQYQKIVIDNRPNWQKWIDFFF